MPKKPPKKKHAAGWSQKGWTVAPKAPGLRARAWDPVAKRYVSKCFPAGARNEAREWAQDQHSKFRLALDRIGPRGSPTVLVVADYVRHLERRQRCAEHIRATRLLLERFAAAVPDLADPEAPRRATAWWDAMDGSKGKRLAEATRNRHLVSVRAMCDFALGKGLATRSPVAGLEPLSLPQNLKAQFTVDELRYLLRQVDDPYHRRFAVLVYTGMRISAATAIRWEDIDWSGRVVQVVLAAGGRLKRRKELLVPLMDELAALLYPHRQPAGPVTTSSLVNCQREFTRFLHRHGLTRAGMSPHSCRHTYAGMMTASGVPSLLLRSYMGHDAEATTAGYAHLAARYVRAVEGWSRGEFRLLEGAHSEWRCPIRPR